MISLTANPRIVRETDFPVDGTPEEQWCFLLNYALLAPSEYNTQPWLFHVQGKSVELYADSSRSLPVVDPDRRELLISCGAACFNLHLAARYVGFQVLMECSTFDERPELLARLSFGARQPATPEEARLFAAIPLRHSNRSVYEDRLVPTEVISRLRTLAGQQGTWLEVVEEEHTRKTIADLIVAGDRRQWADKPFREELAQWVHPRSATSTDGLPGTVGAKGSFHHMSSPFVVRTFDLWREEVARDRQLLAGAPLLAVLGTFTDTAGDWFAAGMAIELVLLEACASGLQTSFVNQPIEVPSLRAWLQQALGRKEFPQLIIRMGYGEPGPSTPRRCVREVLLTSTQDSSSENLPPH